MREKRVKTEMAAVETIRERRLRVDDDDVLSDGDDGRSPNPGGFHNRGLHTGDPHSSSHPNSSQPVGEDVMAVVRAGLEQLLWAVEKDSSVRPLRWLAHYLKQHNTENTLGAAQASREAALQSMGSAVTRNDVYWQSVRAVRTLLWPCSSRLYILDEMDDEIPLSKSEVAAVEAAEAEAQAAAAAAAAAEAQAAAAAAAAAPPDPKGGRSKSPGPGRGPTPPAAKGGKAAPAGKGGKSPREPEPAPTVVEPPPPPPEPVIRTKKVRVRVLRAVSTSHIDASSIAGRVIRRAEGVTWAAVDGEVSLLVPNVLEEEMMLFFDKTPTPGSYIAVPIWESGHVIGALTVDTLLDGRMLTEEDLEFVEEVADIVSEKLDVAAAMEAEQAAALEEQRRLAEEEDRKRREALESEAGEEGAGEGNTEAKE